jgi:hypothetical protein
MPDWVRRAIRTFFQAFTGVLVLQGVQVTIDPTLITNVDWLERVGLTAIAAGGVSAITLIHNFLEDQAGLPALLKSPASVGSDPVPDTGHHLEQH